MTALRVHIPNIIHFCRDTNHHVHLRFYLPSIQRYQKPVPMWGILLDHQRDRYMCRIVHFPNTGCRGLVYHHHVFNQFPSMLLPNVSHHLSSFHPSFGQTTSLSYFTWRHRIPHTIFSYPFHNLVFTIHQFDHKIGCFYRDRFNLYAYHERIQFSKTV